MSTVLVTGAAGFLGSWVCKRLLADGWDVLGLDLMHRSEARRLEGVNLTYQWQHLKDVTEVPPYVVHCASVTDVAYTARSPLDALDRTVTGTAALLEAARRSGVERFVLISSHSVYGRASHQPIVETELLRPGNLYGALKAAQELMALSYWRWHQMPVVVLRSSIMFGEHERAGALVSTFLRKAIAGEDITVTGDGSQTRDMQYVGNTVDGIGLALESPKAVGEVFNIGSGEEFSIRQLAEFAIEITESRSESRSRIAYTDPRPGEEGRMALDISKARLVLKYEPMLSFYQGLTKTADWLMGIKEEEKVA